MKNLHLHIFVSLLLLYCTENSIDGTSHWACNSKLNLTAGMLQGMQNVLISGCGGRAGLGVFSAARKARGCTRHGQ